MKEKDTATMHILNPGMQLAKFYQSLRDSSGRLLMLDYDGTLAPFVAARDQAFPYPGVRELLRPLCSDERTRVVIISGRSVEDLRPLLGIDPHPEIWGSHGWERLHADGRYEAPDLPDGLLDLLSHEWAWLQHTFPPHSLERKPASLAIHWRGLAEPDRLEMQRTTEARWGPFRQMSLVDLHSFDGGIELRTAGRSKGDAVHTLLAEIPPGEPAAYLGDDLTDEDAFAALSGRGLCVLVRNELRPTRADVHCVPPEGLLSFLMQWTKHDQ